ncbi:hypothetical protein K0M31_002367 [Melipona bicolor]|uniref:Uncharacterized protein n=1 Tax=Melipona bicolor TaxID=60889 RepID=A0AA40GHF1_9HYME|nr:hypothetical protein K0M31_002367 [Melipona bicolor]
MTFVFEPFDLSCFFDYYHTASRRCFLCFWNVTVTQTTGDKIDLHEERVDLRHCTYERKWSRERERKDDWTSGDDNDGNVGLKAGRSQQRAAKGTTCRRDPLQVARYRVEGCCAAE